MTKFRLENETIIDDLYHQVRERDQLLVNYQNQSDSLLADYDSLEKENLILEDKVKKRKRLNGILGGSTGVLVILLFVL